MMLAMREMHWCIPLPIAPPDSIAAPLKLARREWGLPIVERLLERRHLQHACTASLLHTLIRQR